MAANLRHRHGGSITTVHSVGHATHQGVAEWFFVADVKWDDGSSSERTQVSPICLGHDSTPESVTECNRLHNAMADYLGRNGRWHNMKHTRDGRHYSWTPKEPNGEQEVRP